jgi:hypothetical protein
MADCPGSPDLSKGYLAAFSDSIHRRIVDIVKSRG